MRSIYWKRYLSTLAEKEASPGLLPEKEAISKPNPVASVVEAGKRKKSSAMANIRLVDFVKETRGSAAGLAYVVYNGGAEASARSMSMMAGMTGPGVVVGRGYRGERAARKEAEVRAVHGGAMGTQN